MLLTVNRTVSQTIELPVPFYAKHNENEWFIMITDSAVIEVLPWSIKIEEKNQFLSMYVDKVEKALSHEYHQTTVMEFLMSYTETKSKLEAIVNAINLETL